MFKRIALVLLLCLVGLYPGRTVEAQSRPIARWMQGAHVAGRTVYGVACSPINYVDQTGTWTLLASAGDENTIKLWRYTVSPGTTGNSNSRLLSTLAGHTDSVLSLAFSPDGKTLASASRDGSIKWWNVGSGVNPTLLRTTYHDDAVTAVAFSPDGQFLASAGYDQMVRLWSTANYSQAKSYVTAGYPLCVAFSSTGDAVAFGEDDGSLYRVRLADNQTTLFTAGSGNPVYTLSFAGKGPSYLAAGIGDTVYVWNVANNGNALVTSLAPNAGDIHAVTFSPDGSLLLAGGDDGALRIWRTFNFSAGCVLSGYTSPVNALAFSPNGLIFSSGNDNSIKLWQLASGQPLTGSVVWTPLGHTAPVHTTAFSPDGNILASSGEDGILKLWRTSDGLLVGSTPVGSSLLTTAFSPDGTLIATGGIDSTLRLWSNTSQPGATLPLKKQLPRLNGIVNTLAFSPVRPQFASGDTSGALYLWSLSDYSSQKLGGAGSGGAIYAVAFSPDGSLLASAGADAIIRIWRPDTSGALLKTLIGHTRAVRALAFSPDGKTLASGGDDNTVRFWSFPAMTSLGAPLSICNSVKSLAFSPNGATLAIGSAGFVSTSPLLQLYRFPARTLFQTYDQETAGGVYNVTFSPESSLLAYGRGDGTVAVASNGDFTPPVPVSIKTNPTVVKGGSSLTGTVTLNAPAPLFTGTLVFLSSSNAGVKLPAGVTVPPGKTTVTFTITTTPLAATNTVVTLIAQLKVSVPPVSTTLTVTP